MVAVASSCDNNSREKGNPYSTRFGVDAGVRAFWFFMVARRWTWILRPRGSGKHGY